MYMVSVERHQQGFQGVVYHREVRSASGLAAITGLGASVILNRETRTDTGLIVPGLFSRRTLAANRVPTTFEDSMTFADLDALVLDSPGQVIQRIGKAVYLYAEPEFSVPNDGDGGFVADSAERTAITEVHRSLVRVVADSAITFGDHTGEYL